MFDATKGAKALTDQVETASNEFAVRFNELPPRQQLVFLERANSLLDDPTQVSAFQAGTYVQSSAGQPALQLGGGGTANAPTPAELAKSIGDFARNTGLRQEQAELAMRALLPASDRGFVEADAGGEPAAVADLREEIRKLTDPRTVGSPAFERAAAEKALAEIQDPAISGSLAAQLAEANAKPAPSGWVQAAELDNLTDQIIEQVNNIGRGGGHAFAKNTALAKLTELKGKVAN